MLSASTSGRRDLGPAVLAGFGGWTTNLAAHGCDDYVLTWNETGDEDPASLDHALLEAFQHAYGKLPVGNQNAGRRRASKQVVLPYLQYDLASNPRTSQVI